MENEEQIKQFWNGMKREMEQITNFRKNEVPLTRIKKIVKADLDVNMVSADLPPLFAKACELFVMDLTFRALLNAKKHRRMILQNSDVLETIHCRPEIYDFLDGIISEAGGSGNGRE